MKLSFTGLSTTIAIDARHVTVLEVENNVLFSRLCQSLVTELGEAAPEPYTLWDEKDGEIKPKGAFLIIPSPLHLPWEDRRMTGKLYARMEKLLLENADLRQRLVELNSVIGSEMMGISCQMQSDYHFAVEWELSRYLKAFGYGVDTELSQPLFDNLMKYLSLAADVSFPGVLLWINIRAFLSQKQLFEMCERAVFLNLKMLVMEQQHYDERTDAIRKVHIDRDFIEVAS